MLENLKTVTAYARKNLEEFYRIATENGEAEAKKIINTSEKEKTDIQKRITQLDYIIKCLYEDKVIGRITAERYDKMAKEYENEQE